MLSNYKILIGIIIFLLIFGYIYKIKSENTQYIEEIGNCKLTISEQKKNIDFLSSENKALEEQNKLNLSSIDSLQKQINNLKINNQTSLENLEQLYASALEDAHNQCSIKQDSIPLDTNSKRANTLNEKFLNMRNNIYDSYIKH